MEKRINKLTPNIIQYLENNLEENKPEKEEILMFLKNNHFSVFPYNFIKKYNQENVNVHKDADNWKYILHQGKKMYFPKSWSDQAIQGSYNGLLLEQDKESPHHYENSGFCVQDGDIVADIGTAEGIFALSIIEKVKKIYLFECYEAWIETLKKTFEPWKEKVVIVNKYVGDCKKNDCITLDGFLNGDPINFIKADIEGMEISLLKGARKTLITNNNLRIVLCTYHKQNDGQCLSNILMENGFNVEFSKGYMINIYDKNLVAPYLRRGVIRAKK
jgi:hypothetical protein